MNDFEQRLRAALERQEPSPDFAARVLERVAREERRSRTSWKPWAAGCIAASLLMGSWGAVEFRKQRDLRRGQLAHAQLIRALEITSSKLQRIQRKLDNLNHE